MRALSCAILWGGLTWGGLAEGNAQESRARITDGGGGGASVVVKPPKKQPAVYETTVKLQAARQWKSSDGKSIVAELMSWPIKGAKVAPKDIQQVKIEVIREKKIRLRTAGKITVVRLDRLSKEDQDQVGELAKYHETWRVEERKKGAGVQIQGERVRKN